MPVGPWPTSIPGAKPLGGAQQHSGEGLREEERAERDPGVPSGPARDEKKRQREQLKQLPLRERIAIARRLSEGLDAELPDAPVTRERFHVDVRENIDTAGFHTTEAEKDRYTVTDTVTGRIQTTGYQFSQRMAQSLGNAYVTKILNGKWAIK